MARWTALTPRVVSTFTHVVGVARRAVDTARHWLSRPKPRAIIPPYVNLRTRARFLSKIFLPIGLGFFCLIYGFFFALTAPYLVVPFTVPIVLLVLLAIWALPDQAHAPARSIELFFGWLIISLVLWPNYLALSLPGLPWITMLRLTGFPMAFLILISLSTSPAFRREIGETVRSVPFFWGIFLTFVVMQFITIVFAKALGVAIQKALLQQIYWTAMTVIAAWVCRTPGRAERYAALTVVLALPIMALTLWEGRVQHLLWAGHVPSFLKIEDPGVILALSATTRTASGVYRAKATFSTPLGLAEYLALITPFLLHYVFSSYRWPVRVGAALLLPILFRCINLTDSRLGVVGYLVSVLLYVLFWGVMRLSRNRTDLFAAAVVYAYPAFFGVAMIGILAVGRLKRMVFGGGAQAASNAARDAQVSMGVPKVLANPIGHGPSQGGNAMGYGADSFITIDNYYLTLALDYGIVGITAFLAMFLLPIAWSMRALLLNHAGKNRELTLLIPLSISISAFLVIKGVFSQQDNHTLVFAMLGMIIGLLYRIKVEQEGLAVAKAGAVKAASQTPRRRSGLAPASQDAARLRAADASRQTPSGQA